MNIHNTIFFITCLSMQFIHSCIDILCASNSPLSFGRKNCERINKSSHSQNVTFSQNISFFVIQIKVVYLSKGNVFTVPSNNRNAHASRLAEDDTDQLKLMIKVIRRLVCDSYIACSVTNQLAKASVIILLTLTINRIVIRE